MSIFTLYLLTTVIPGFSMLLELLTGLGIIGTIIGTVIISLINEEFHTRVFKKACWIFIPIAFLAIAFPNQKQIYTIIGGAYALNIEGIEKLPPNIVDAANNFLEKMKEGE